MCQLLDLALTLLKFWSMWLCDHHSKFPTPRSDAAQHHATHSSYPRTLSRVSRP